MPQSDIGKTVIELVKHLAFEMSSQYAEKGIAEPKELAMLAVTVQRLEQAESLSHKREQAIRKEMAQLAAETAEKAVVQAGLSADTVRTIKEQILGIA